MRLAPLETAKIEVQSVVHQIYSHEPMSSACLMDLVWMGQFVVPYLLNPIPMDTRLALQRLRLWKYCDNPISFGAMSPWIQLCFIDLVCMSKVVLSPSTWQTFGDYILGWKEMLMPGWRFEHHCDDCEWSFLCCSFCHRLILNPKIVKTSSTSHSHTNIQCVFHLTPDTCIWLGQTLSALYILAGIIVISMNRAFKWFPFCGRLNFDPKSWKAMDYGSLWLITIFGKNGTNNKKTFWGIIWHFIHGVCKCLSYVLC